MLMNKYLVKNCIYENWLLVAQIMSCVTAISHRIFIEQEYFYL